MFSRIFGSGTYCYADSPKEYLEMKATKDKMMQGIFSITQSGVETTIVENFQTSLGQDEYVDLDGRSWI